MRVMVIAIILIAIRWRMGIESLPLWLTRLMLLTAICGSVATWFRFLVPTIGSADSYGYVSASQLIAQGSLVAEAPVAGWLSAPNRLAIASPLGWSPSADGLGIVPAYPLGLPLLMALFTVVGGPGAVFFVAPCAAAITLLLVYRLASSWYDSATALLATALVAWNPVLIAYAKQPMSDVPATMWLVLALCLAVRATSATALASGLAAGAVLITKPALLLAAAIIPWAAHRGDTPRRRAVLSAAALAVGLAVQLLIQHQLFGSPFSTGYGASSALFSWTHVTTNLAIFAKHGWMVVGPLWILGLIIGLFASRPEPRSIPAMIFVAVLIPYVFYLPFDHWETLRYLLPGIVPLTVTVADGLMHFARAPRNQIATAVMLCAFAIVAVAQSELLLRRSSVWDIASMEARYPLAGDWINVNTPANSVVLANQHSGSLRWYGKRQTLRWDFIAPEDLARTVGEVESHGSAVYVALEGAEVAMFDAKFANVIGELTVDHVGRTRNVQFLRLSKK
jgi:4-amino-4-deoxy-L-arabinose transferase-like glycosyltransferase